MGNFVKVAAEIRVDNFSMPSVDQLVDVPDGIRGAAVFPIGILFWLQIGLEDRFEYQNRSHLAALLADGRRVCLPLWTSVFSQRTVLAN